MTDFRYVGTITKANGKVDLKVFKPTSTHYFEALDVTPNTDIVTIIDAAAIKAVQNHRDHSGTIVWQEQP